MKKMISLRKIQFESEQKKTCGNESREKETKYIYAIATDYMSIGNLDWCKCRHCRNEVREMDCLCCREVLRLKSQSAKEAYRHPAFMGNCPTFSHTC